MATKIKTTPWREIRRHGSADAERQIETTKARMRRDMRLADLRKARELTQTELAESMDIPQGEVSKIERRTDLYLSTLRRFIEAMNGELVLVARFPDGDVTVQLKDLAEA